MKPQFLSVFYALTLSILTLAASDSPRKSEWTDFEASLLSGQSGEGTLADLVTIESLKKNSDFKAALNNKDQALFLEMIRQEDSAVVRVVGFVGISKLQPKRSLEMAYSLILDANNLSASIYYPAIETIQTAKYDAVFVEEFSRAACRRGKNPVALDLILRATPIQSLDRWFHSESKLAVPLSSEANILVVLVEFYEASKEPLSTLMRSKLEGFKSSKSVIANFAFLYALEEDDQTYQTLLANTLQNKEISREDFLTLLSKRKKFISEHPDLKTLSLPEDRQKAFLQIISKFEKH